MSALLRIEQQDETLDSLLCRWHQWQLGYGATKGYNSRTLVAGDYRTSRQYDDQNGALDEDIETIIMQQVDHEVRSMHDPYRAAIYVVAKALTYGVEVFRSPRLPDDQAARDLIISDARSRLIARLVSAGVM